MKLDHLSPELREEAVREWGEYLELLEENPLHRFHACKTDCGLPGCKPHPQQHEFMSATTRVQAAFAGNRFGKTTALIVKALCQLLDEDMLPERLKPFKHRDAPCKGRLVVPGQSASIYGYVLPKFREWCPKAALVGGGFNGKPAAYDKANRVLRFANGSEIDFLTYEMDLDKFGGVDKDFIAYDEPPPEDIRREGQMRLIDRAGWEMFAMTPLMGIGWVYRDIWKKREAPHITVVKGSIHDNPNLDAAMRDAILGEYDKDDPERKAREFGDFAHFGGMIYPGGFEHRLCDPPTPEHVKSWEVVVGMDPGLKNAAFVWVGFDTDQKAWVFDEVLLQEQTPLDYVRAIRQVNSKWGLRQPTFVIDPSARNRSLINAESVEGELNRVGIYCVHGQNDQQAGVQQVRRRLQHGMLHVSRECRGLRDESEEYRAEQRDDGEFKVVKENDHRLDALRYALMYIPWGPQTDERQRDGLGWEWEPGTAPNQAALTGRREYPPMGVMS